MRKTLMIALIGLGHAVLTLALGVADFSTGFNVFQPSPAHPYVEAALRVVEFPLLWISLIFDPRQYIYGWVMVPNSLLWALAIFYCVKWMRGAPNRQPA